MGLIFDGASARDLILDGHSVSLYAGGNPPVKVWPTTDMVQITLGTGAQAQDQLRAALSARGLSYTTVTEIPFDIELVGGGTTKSMFYNCAELTSVPEMDTSNVTDMENMFSGCTALTSVPDMDTSSVTNMAYMFANCWSLIHAPEMDTSQVTTMSSMFDGCSSLTYVPDMVTSKVADMNFMLYGCEALTDGNVRFIGKHPQLYAWDMITFSGLTREPFYNASGSPI